MEYFLRTRVDDAATWSPAETFPTRKARDKAASFARIIGGLRTHSFEERTPKPSPTCLHCGALKADHIQPLSGGALRCPTTDRQEWLPPGSRYCEMCDTWSRAKVCKSCGAETSKGKET